MFSFQFAPSLKGRAEHGKEVKALASFAPSFRTESLSLFLFLFLSLPPLPASLSISLLWHQEARQTLMMFKTDQFFTTNIFISEATKTLRQKQEIC